MTLTPLQKKFKKVFLDGLNSHLKRAQAMSRPGVTFTDKQQTQITNLVESNKIADAQKIIFDELQRQL